MQIGLHSCHLKSDEWQEKKCRPYFAYPFSAIHSTYIPLISLAVKDFPIFEPRQEYDTNMHAVWLCYYANSGGYGKSKNWQLSVHIYVH
jgi:hypothetical protein